MQVEHESTRIGLAEQQRVQRAAGHIHLDFLEALVEVELVVAGNVVAGKINRS